MPPRQQTQQQRPSSSDVAALVAAQAAAREPIVRQAVEHAAIAARQFRHWYDTDAVAEWSAKLARQMESYQRTLAGITDAYLARAVAMLAGGRPRPIGPVDVTGLRQGVTHAGAYGRAADVYRWQQSRFDRYGERLATDPAPSAPVLELPETVAVQRAADVADLDTQLATRAQESANLSAAAELGIVTGYRRVIHPELSTGGVCGLCIAASDRLYGPDEPRAIHARCKCTTLPVVGHADPGSALNDLDLRRVYRDAGSTKGEALKRTRYQIGEHGELGLVLQPAGVRARTARDARRDEKTPPRRSAAELHDLLRKRRDKLAAALPKARDLNAQDPKQWGNYLAQLEQRVRDLDDQLAA